MGVKGHYKEEIIPCKVDDKGNLYFEDACKKEGVKIPENAKDTFFCIDCGWAILEGDILIIDEIKFIIKAMKANGLEVEF